MTRARPPSPSVDIDQRGPISEPIVEVLRDQNADWTLRVNALQTLVEEANGVSEHSSSAEYKALLHQFRTLAPSFGFLISDLRSTLVREACIALEKLVVAHGSSFVSSVDKHVIPALLKRAGTSKAVIRDSANDAATALFRFGLSGVSDAAAQQLSNAIRDRKSAPMTRSSAASFLGMFLTDKKNVSNLTIQEALEQAIFSGLSDPDQEVRCVSRQNWLLLAKINEKAALALLSELPPNVASTLQEIFDQHVRRILQPSDIKTPLQLSDRLPAMSRSPRRGLEPSLHSASENVPAVTESLSLSDGQQYLNNPSRLHAPVRSSLDFQKTSFPKPSQQIKALKPSRPFNRPPRRSVAAGALTKPLVFPSAGTLEHAKAASESQKSPQVNITSPVVDESNDTDRVLKAGDESNVSYARNRSPVKRESCATGTFPTSTSCETSKHNPSSVPPPFLPSNSCPTSKNPSRKPEEGCSSSSSSDPSVFKHESKVFEKPLIRRSTSYPGSQVSMSQPYLSDADIISSKGPCSTRTVTNISRSVSIEELPVVMRSAELVNQAPDGDLIKSTTNRAPRDKSEKNDFSYTLNRASTVEPNSCVSLEAHDQIATFSELSCSSTKLTNSAVDRHNLLVSEKSTASQELSGAKHKRRDVMTEQASSCVNSREESCAISTISNHSKVESPRKVEKIDIAETKGVLEHEISYREECIVTVSDYKPRIDTPEITRSDSMEITMACTPESSSVPSGHDNKGRLSFILGSNITPAVVSNRHRARLDTIFPQSFASHDGGKKSGDIGPSIALTDEAYSSGRLKELSTRGISAPDFDTDIDSPSKPPHVEEEKTNSHEQSSLERDPPPEPRPDTNSVKPNAIAMAECDILNPGQLQKRRELHSSAESNDVYFDNAAREEKSVEKSTATVVTSCHKLESQFCGVDKNSTQPSNFTSSSKEQLSKRSNNPPTFERHMGNASHKGAGELKDLGDSANTKAAEKENRILAVQTRRPSIPNLIRKKSHITIPTKGSSIAVKSNPRNSIASSLHAKKASPDPKEENLKSGYMDEKQTSAAAVPKNETTDHAKNRGLPGKRTLRASSAIGSLFSGVGKVDNNDGRAKRNQSSRVQRMASHQSGSRLPAVCPPIPGKSRETVSIQRGKSVFTTKEKSANAASLIGVPRSYSFKTSSGITSKSSGSIPSVNPENRSALRSRLLESTNGENWKSSEDGSCLGTLRSSIVKLRGGRGDWKTRLEKMNDVKVGLEALSRSELNSSIAEECLSVIGEAMNDVHYKMTVLALDCLFLLLLRTEGDAGSSALHKLLAKRVDILRRVLQVCKESKEDVKLAGQRFFTSFEMQFAAEAQVGLLLRAMGIESCKIRSHAGSRPGMIKTFHSGVSTDARILEIGCRAVKRAFERAERCDGGFLWSGSTLEAILVGMSVLSADRRPQVRQAADEVVQAVNRCLPEGAFKLACRKFGLKFASIEG